MIKDRDEAIKEMRERLKPGDIIRTTVRHVSRSGMYRAIDAYVIQENEMLRYSWTIARALGDRYDKNHEAIGVSGCGMDMCFHIVYNLGRTLWPDGFDCIGKGCPANDHSNGENKKHHSDSGYALVNRSF